MAPVAGRFDTVLFDLDDCLYRVQETPLLMRARIEAYMGDKLGIPPADIKRLCLEYYTNYGTTLAGLVANGYEIDTDDWHSFVHGTLPYNQLLCRDEPLRHLLLSIRQPKWVFTNSDIRHAERCLDIMGVRDCFVGIVCFETMQALGTQLGLVHRNVPVLCKPNAKAMELALKATGATASSTLYLDDSTRNIAAGSAAGMFSVLVGRTGANCGADFEIETIHGLPAALPELFATPAASLSAPHPDARPAGALAGTAVPPEFVAGSKLWVGETEAVHADGIRVPS